MGLQRKNHGLTPGGVGGHDRIRHHIRRDRERLVVNKLAVNGGARGEALATTNTWPRRPGTFNFAPRLCVAWAPCVYQSGEQKIVFMRFSVLRRGANMFCPS